MPVSIVVVPPAFSENTYQPNFNPQRSLPANNVQGEVHYYTVDQVGERIIVVPRHAPFFAEDFVIDLQTTSGTRRLVAGIDFLFVLPFLSASRSCGKAIWGGIELVGINNNGNAKVDYSCLGSTWTYRRGIGEANAFFYKNDARTTSWEQYANYQSAFPQVFGAWDQTDSTKEADYNAALELTAGTLKNRFISRFTLVSTLTDHIFNFNNPHGYTAATLGLSQLANLPAATDAQAADPTNNDVYISHLQLPLAFGTATPIATDTAPGISMKIDPLLPNASNSQTRFLSAANIVSFAGLPTTDLGNALNRAQKKVNFTGVSWREPNPSGQGTRVRWPKVFRGVSYNDFEPLRLAVERDINLTGIEMDQVNGAIWIPADKTPPNLTLS